LSSQHSLGVSYRVIQLGAKPPQPDVSMSQSFLQRKVLQFIHHLTVIVGEEVGITVGDAVVAPYVGTMLLLGEADEIMLGRRDSCNDGDVVGLSVLSTEGNADGTKVGSAVGIGAVGALVTSEYWMQDTVPAG